MYQLPFLFLFMHKMFYNSKDHYQNTGADFFTIKKILTFQLVALRYFKTFNSTFGQLSKVYICLDSKNVSFFSLAKTVTLHENTQVNMAAS